MMIGEASNIHGDLSKVEFIDLVDPA